MKTIITEEKTQFTPIELEIKDATNTDRSASYLGLHLEIDSEERLRTKQHLYIDYISQLIRYSRASGFP